jgi:hypothetical protein
MTPRGPTKINDSIGPLHHSYFYSAVDSGSLTAAPRGGMPRLRDRDRARAADRHQLKLALPAAHTGRLLPRGRARIGQPPRASSVDTKGLISVGVKLKTADPHYSPSRQYHLDPIQPSGQSLFRAPRWLGPKGRKSGTVLMARSEVHRPDALSHTIKLNYLNLKTVRRAESN